MPFWEALGVALAGGLIGLDRLVFGQFMISQPIVAAPLIGLLLGDFHSGLLIGAVLELFWLRGLPVGGYVPRDATLAAILTAGLALPGPISGHGVEPAWIAWVFIWVGLLLVPAGLMNAWIRKKNAFLISVARAAEFLDAGVSKAVRMGIFLFFLYYFGVILAGILILRPIVNLGFNLLSEQMLQGLRLFLFLLPSIGIASLFTRKHLMRGGSQFAAGGIASLLLFVVFKQQNLWTLLVFLLLASALVVVDERRRARV